MAADGGTRAVVTAMKSLLIGEAAAPEDISRIHDALLGTAHVDRVIQLRTMHLGPEELLVANIGISADDDGETIATTIDRAEARIRAAVPSARIVYLEPDVHEPQPRPA